jgi:hypothetical protein
VRFAPDQHSLVVPFAEQCSFNPATDYVGRLAHSQEDPLSTSPADLERQQVEVQSTISSTIMIYAVLIFLPLVFFVCFFNRFAGLYSGDGEYTSGVVFLRGVVPYRDYFSIAPPFNLLKSAMLLKTFGVALMVSRSAGVVERLLIAVVLFSWLTKIFRPTYVLVACVATVILSAADLTDPVASYNHDCILLVMLSGLAASAVLSQWDGKARFCAFSALSGIFAALSLLTKQTIGLGEVLAILVVVAILLFKLDSASRALMWCGMFLCGCALPLAGLVMYLHHLGAFHSFFQMLFVSGPAAKAGHPSDFLTREIQVALGSWRWLGFGILALVLTASAVLRAIHSKGDDERPNAMKCLRYATYVLFVGIVVIGGAKLWALGHHDALQNSLRTLVYYTIVLLTLLVVGFVTEIFRPGMSVRQAQCILFCVVSWVVTLTLSLSWPAFEAMLLPGFGFLVAAALQGARPHHRKYIYIVLATAVFLAARAKLDVPFAFIPGHEERVSFATTVSVQPQMRGMRLPADARDFLDGTIALIQDRTKSNDTIFTFPEMSLIYALADRRPPTWSWSHNIDVVNDRFAREEAGRLRERPPAVIIYCPPSEASLLLEERAWRQGERSSQRDLIDVVESIARGYELRGSYHPMGPGGPMAFVYVRPQVFKP